MQESALYRNKNVIRTSAANGMGAGYIPDGNMIGRDEKSRPVFAPMGIPMNFNHYNTFGKICHYIYIIYLICNKLLQMVT